jgi:hypothetical protein
MYVFEGGGAVRNEKVFEIEAARNTLHFQLHEPNLNRELDRELPDAPVMSDTLLMLELAVRERVVDLSEVTQLVLGDLGAAIQIMRLARREGLSGRMENCISGLGVQACLDAVARRPIKRGTCDPAIAELWSHAKRTADNCKFLAEEAFLPVNPDHAYLVGLFHAVGALPSVLGWERTPQVAGNHDAVGLRMALAWSLPDCVVAYFSEIPSRSSVIRWKEMVRSAHQEANGSRTDSAVCNYVLLHDPVNLWAPAVSS